MAEISSESRFFSGNIANMLAGGPLNKVLPLTEDHSLGGGWGLGGRCVCVCVWGGGGGGGGGGGVHGDPR